MWHMTPETWHMTHDTWHMTHDRFGEVNLLSKFQHLSSYGLGLKVLWRYFHKESLTKSINLSVTKQSFIKLKSWGRKAAQLKKIYCALFFTFERQTGKASFFLKWFWHHFDKILQNCTCFYCILGSFLCANLSVWQFGCAKEFTFRRSVTKVFVEQSWLHQVCQ